MRGQGFLDKLGSLDDRLDSLIGKINRRMDKPHGLTDGEINAMDVMLVELDKLLLAMPSK